MKTQYCFSHLFNSLYIPLLLEEWLYPVVTIYIFSPVHSEVHQSMTPPSCWFQLQPESTTPEDFFPIFFPFVKPFSRRRAPYQGNFYLATTSWTLLAIIEGNVLLFFKLIIKIKMIVCFSLSFYKFFISRILKTNSKPIVWDCKRNNCIVTFRTGYWLLLLTEYRCILYILYNQCRNQRWLILFVLLTN